MPTTKIVEIEERVRVLEGQMSTSATALDMLTDRVDAIAQSLGRIEGTIQAFLIFLKKAIKWGGGIILTTAVGTLVTYIATHFFH